MHYKKQLKRLQRTRKLVGQQRDLLRAMALEGITSVTFHTTTRQLTLSREERAANEAAAVYDEWLSKHRKELKEEADTVVQQWAADNHLSTAQ